MAVLSELERARFGPMQRDPVELCSSAHLISRLGAPAKPETARNAKGTALSSDALRFFQIPSLRMCRDQLTGGMS
jgi:hypothetical protein